MNREEHEWAVVCAAYAAAMSGNTEGPVPAPVELCEELHGALMAAYNVLGKTLSKWTTGPESADVRNQRARLKRLADQLESRHMRSRAARFRQKGEEL